MHVPSAWILEGEMCETDPNPTSSLDPGADESQGTRGKKAMFIIMPLRFQPCYVVLAKQKLTGTLGEASQSLACT